MIALVGIAKHIGNRTLFENVNLTIGVGERIGLVGANGSGKTTLLEIMAGRIEPDAGSMTQNRHATVGYLEQELPSDSSEPLLTALLAGHEQLESLAHRLELVQEEMRETTDPAELEALTRRFGELEDRFANSGGYDLPARANKILAGLGFRESDHDRPTRAFSGGWLMRLALGRLLLTEPDLLLLDEPTNYLDLSSVVWLENYLRAYEGSMVIVSHDRTLLNELALRILELDRQTITSYTGDYDDFVVARAQRQEGLEAQRKAQQREIEQTQRFIDRFRYKATKARQVQSRIKRLEKMERVETAGTQRTMRFQFPAPPRCSRVQLELDNVWKSYDGPPVYTGIDLKIEHGDRIALVGPNGAGKSTLLKMLAGVLDPTRGERRLGHGVVVGYYAQHQIEALGYGRTILEEMRLAAPAATDEALRRLLGCFLFSGEDVFKRISVLSGGEKARVALAKALIAAPNLLLLDEPTSHLDIAARQVLEDALSEYEGSLVMISHDRHFIDALTNRVVEAGGGDIRIYLGNFSDYQARMQEEDATAPPPSTDGDLADRDLASTGRTRRSREERRRAAEARNKRNRRLRPLRHSVASLEREIEVLTTRAEELEALMASPEFYESAEFETTFREYNRVKAETAAKTERWEEAHLELEALEHELSAGGD